MAEPELPADYNLPEFPHAIQERLSAAGVWSPNAKSIKALAEGRARKRFPDDIEPTFEQKLYICYEGWKAVTDRWPAHYDTTPCTSLLEYFNDPENKDAARYQLAYANRHRNASPVKEEDERRWDLVEDKTDYAVDMTWVYHNLQNKRADSGTAPSRGAWTVYCEVRRKERKGKGSGIEWFMKSIWPKISDETNRRKRDGDANEGYVPSKDEKKAIHELEQLLKDAVEQSKELVNV